MSEQGKAENRRAMSLKYWKKKKNKSTENLYLVKKICKKCKIKTSPDTQKLNSRLAL